MAYSEQITIAIIRDSGERRSLRMSRRLFLCLVVFPLLMVPLCSLSVWLAWDLWRENGELASRLQKTEKALAEAKVTAERLGNLETLLTEAHIDGKEYVLRNLANAKGTPRKTAPAKPGDTGNGAAPAESPEPQEQPQIEDGVDQEQFQGVDTGYVRVGNVSVRLDRQRRQRVLRLALDLHNTEKQEVASGSVEAFLLTVDGEKTSLEYTVKDAGHFRINFFKRAVMLSQLPAHLTLTNAQVIVEIRNHEHTLVYSNLFPVEQ